MWVLSWPGQLKRLPCLKRSFAPENQWLVQMKFPELGFDLFSGAFAMSFRECI